MARVSKLKTRIGFSTVELLITIGVLAVLSGVSIFGVFAVKNSQNFKLDAQMIAEAIRFTQSKAQLGDGGIPWGIRFTNNAGGSQVIEIFSGSSYSASSTVETHQLSNTNIFTNPAPGFSEIILFEAVRGIPLGAQSIAIKKKSGAGDVYVVSLNSMGKIGIQLETNMIGYWSFDEGSGSTAYDTSGNGIVGNIEFYEDPWEVYGKSGGSVKFDGDELIKLQQSIEVSNANWTVSAWMKVGENGSYALLSNHEGKDLLNEFGIEGSSMIYYYYSDTSMSWENVSGSVDVTRAWRFLTWVNNYDTQTIDMYVDGILDVSNNAMAPIGGRAMINTMGKGFFRGTSQELEMDDVRIYSKAFSAQEVKNLYEQY